MKTTKLLTLAFIITLMASTASAHGFLWAGQNLHVGQVWTHVVVDSDGDPNLMVIYDISLPGWSMTSTSLHVAPLAVAPLHPAANIPQTKKGNPKVGKFDYKTIHIPSVTQYTYFVPLAPKDEEGNVIYDWTGETLVIAAHAVVQELGQDEYGNPIVLREETAWGDKYACDNAPYNLFPGKNWATYFIYYPEPQP